MYFPSFVIVYVILKRARLEAAVPGRMGRLEEPQPREKSPEKPEFLQLIFENENLLATRCHVVLRRVSDHP